MARDRILRDCSTLRRCCVNILFAARRVLARCGRHGGLLVQRRGGRIVNNVAWRVGGGRAYRPSNVWAGARTRLSSSVRGRVFLTAGGCGNGMNLAGISASLTTQVFDGGRHRRGKIAWQHQQNSKSE